MTTADRLTALANRLEAAASMLPVKYHSHLKAIADELRRDAERERQSLVTQ